MKKEVVEIAAKIGQFYLQKNDGDYTAAEKDLRALDITKIEVENEKCKTCKGSCKVVTITCTRVGLLIGVKGKNLDALGNFLGDSYMIKIKEEVDSIYNYLIPYAEEGIDWSKIECNNQGFEGSINW